MTHNEPPKTEPEAIKSFFTCLIKFSIRHPIDSRDLDSWYEQYKPEILAISNDFFFGRTNHIKTIDHIEKVLIIIKLREKEELTFAEIADKICEDYPDEEDVKADKINEESVRQIYNRYKKRFIRDTK
jgi:hypothetical protein